MEKGCMLDDRERALTYDREKGCLLDVRERVLA